LNLSYKSLTNIPKEICNLQQLHSLFLYDNKLTEIPEEIGNLQQLQRFYLYNNQLTEIPKEIGNLCQLRTLYIAKNQLTQIPKGPPCLPKEICNLQQLQELDLSNNQLTEMPKEIGNLQQLRGLYLNHNQFTEMPKEIGNLQQLRCLYCDHNELTQIPKEIGKLRQLQCLQLGNNQLTQIPISIIYLPALYILNISNNPIAGLHPAINRFLQRQKVTQNIYKDMQSVHSHNIEFTTNKSVIDFISNYQCKQININTIIEELDITKPIKNILLNYCKDNYIHSKLQLKYKEILLPVLDFIKNSIYKEKLLKILNQEILESEGKCLQGRISRTINILNGYSEFVNINISNNEQIGNLIINLKNKYLDLSKLKEQFILEMKERNYTDDIINEWINYIQENY